ncbi:MAG TPA: aldehyde dehydrogenase family protein [Opitutaceae bacterium]|nr:aldehyde dehydrogenase family protein [Opitutaceae bacterium]
MQLEPILISGHWSTPAEAPKTFNAFNPATGEALAALYPVSPWHDLDEMLRAGTEAAAALARTAPEAIAGFLEDYANRIQAHADELVRIAHIETALAEAPRLRDVELPRTINQLRQAAAAAREGSWSTPTIDTKLNIRSRLEPLGKPVVVMGPNNFPYAFNGIAGGDFAAAIAAGNPVIAKAHPAHAGTTRVLARLAHEAVVASGLPAATVQMFYRCAAPDGLRLMSDPRTGALGFTGGRPTGLKLKAAADAAGVPAYFELGSVNPVVILPGALAERGTALATEFAGSCLLGVGQFCTNPGIVLVVRSETASVFLNDAVAKFSSSPAGALLAPDMPAILKATAAHMVSLGADLLCGGSEGPSPGFRFQSTLLSVKGATFLKHPKEFQEEMFGPCSVVVVADDEDQLEECVALIEPGLTGSLYTATDGSDDALHDRLVPLVARNVGRVLNDKMPTGVAVSPAMVHGGPYPAAGHPGFTAVGIPASIRRFAALRCYDSFRPARLPAILRDANPGGLAWRLVDGAWTRDDIAR